ncbi:MAG: translation elongation factor-like protein [Candidatus Micrarchaeia archaeon]
MYDLDNVMDVLNELEKKSSKNYKVNEEQNKQIEKKAIGTVENYFPKINVVAIKLDDELNVGDLIEIGTDDEYIRQRVKSMQINREEVYTAASGDSVGIKLRYKVEEGESVFKIL